MKTKKRFGKEGLIRIVASPQREATFLEATTSLPVTARALSNGSGACEVKTPTKQNGMDQYYQQVACRRAPPEADYYMIIHPNGRQNGRALIQYYQDAAS